MDADTPEQVEAAHAHELVERGEAILIDVRDAGAYAESHAAGARSVPIDELEAHLDELPDGVQVITSCGGGTRGPRAAALLREHGVDAHAVRGGLRAWKAAELPVDAGDQPAT
jgi:rhodanese-related sulfurtransferase